MRVTKKCCHYTNQAYKTTNKSSLYLLNPGARSSEVPRGLSSAALRFLLRYGASRVAAGGNHKTLSRHLSVHRNINQDDPSLRWYNANVITPLKPTSQSTRSEPEVANIELQTV